MLRTISTREPAGAPSIELDFHIPVRLRYPRNRRDIPDYWRTGNLDSTFLEIGVLPVSGQVVALTLTSMDSWTELDTPPPPTPSQPGVPVVDTVALPTHINDAPGPIGLGIGPDFLVIELVPGAKVLRELRDDRLRFLVGEDGVWVGLVVTGCDADGLREVRAGVQRSQQTLGAQHPR